MLCCYMEVALFDSYFSAILVIIAAYSVLGSEEELPLGRDFQDHMNCFIDHNQKCPTKKYAMAEKLIRHLQ